MKVIILPGQTLEISLVPAKDASLSPINYLINATTASGPLSNSSLSIVHPISFANLSGLPQHNAGTVTVEAVNPGAVSETVSVNYRMVNLIEDAAGRSAFICYYSEIHVILTSMLSDILKSLCFYMLQVQLPVSLQNG